MANLLPLCLCPLFYYPHKTQKHKSSAFSLWLPLYFSCKTREHKSAWCGPSATFAPAAPPHLSVALGTVPGASSACQIRVYVYSGMYFYSLLICVRKTVIIFGKCGLRRQVATSCRRGAISWRRVATSCRRIATSWFA